MTTCTRELRKLALTTLLALSALLCSAPAVAGAAPDSRAAYLNSLNQHGISYNDPTHMVEIGTTLCHELRNNLVPQEEAVSRIQNMGYSGAQANVIAASAVLSFCPDMDADAK
ncbi:DUF732 domain-containing protein [Mycobacterium shigaense]|uniref:Uncharacterized protein n=1 Tax=Mycobacterium shigaense TaxID=722731 RepID=A0A1Z4EM13_9MYCO|nr:DUF732 domain-containing protein [Mycobacterium shigaense]MEA1120868.1 DUF732 domain-containing protein [Mycobacterium shigaense]PRI12855.1 hypothetical protein B2J96_22430 [Mycobacterium shigaense]BAX94037.1 hypothetical protein MSG_03911 [Mycobacterium shigaense]